MNNLLCAIRAAIKAGTAIMEVYDDKNSDFQIERKADNSPLTIADKKAHNEIVTILKSTPFPILSEEGASIDFSRRKEWNTLWIVDPLDGTKEFIKRNGEFTVNIALVENGIPILGVVYLPTQDILYFGERGIGAYKLINIDINDNIDTLIYKSEKLPLKKGDRKYTIVASRSHLSTETQEYIEGLEKKHGDINFISSGSSIKIVLIAEGTADCYPRFAPTMEWDTAAGDAVARAAGAGVYMIDEATPLIYNKENLLNPFFIVK